jgi:hypothetical protein
MLINVNIIRRHPNAPGVVRIGSDLIGELWVYEEHLERAALASINREKVALEVAMKYLEENQKGNFVLYKEIGNFIEVLQSSISSKERPHE